MKLIRVTQATAVSLLLTAALAACGGAGDEDADTATDAGPSAVQGAPDGAPDGPPGASGLVAAVSGRTAQVQSEMAGQVAVSWTADTTFTEEVDATFDDVTVGSCVVVGSDADPGATEIAATSVRILDGCDDLAGGMPSEMPSELPSDLPTDMPEGGGRPGGFGTVGEVSAVTESGFTVTAMESEVTVTVSGDTTYTTTAEATDAALRTGVCVTAQGETDDTGALTAASIGVSKPVEGQCTGGFMGRPGGAA